jgi:hypothetical protein
VTASPGGTVVVVAAGVLEEAGVLEGEVAAIPESADGSGCVAGALGPLSAAEPEESPVSTRPLWRHDTAAGTRARANKAWRKIDSRFLMLRLMATFVPTCACEERCVARDGDVPLCAAP